MPEHTTPTPLSALSRQLEQRAEAASDAVVSVRSHGRPLASGVVWQPGVIVTANDVLEADADISVVTAAGKSVQTQIAGRDPTTDIAVLRSGEDLPARAGMTTGEEVRVGQLVLAVGRGGDGVVASVGMVAVAGGAWQSRRGGNIDRLIRLDMRLDRYGEGGIVVDGEGRLVGMPVFGPRQRPLVIPATTIERVVPKLLAEGRIMRGYLGVGAQSIRLDEALTAVHGLSDPRAIIVVSVDPKGPARKAGVLLGDVILSLDGNPVPGLRSLFARLTPEMVDKAIELKILRAGQITTARVTIGASPAP